MTIEYVHIFFPKHFLYTTDNKQDQALLGSVAHLILMHTTVISIPSFSKVIPSGKTDHICLWENCLFVISATFKSKRVHTCDANQ